MGKGDRVAAVLSNSVEFLVIHLALLKIGVVFVPLNPQLTPSHIEYIANHQAGVLPDRVVDPLVHEDLQPAL